jgi:hypothetical protein
VHRDTQILLKDLTNRESEFLRQLTEESLRLTSKYMAEKAHRDATDRAALEASLIPVTEGLRALNAQIVELVEGLAASGWTTMGGIPVNPHGYAIELHNRFSAIRPPARDDGALDEEYEAEKDRINAIRSQVMAQADAADRSVQAREAEMLRDLTLMSITTEAAREFILSMPTAEMLLPPPEGLAIEADTD